MITTSTFRRRKLRRDAVLKKLQNPQRDQIRAWLDAEGEAACRQRIFSELHIASPQDPTKPVGPKMLYQAINFWAAEELVQKAFYFRDAQVELMRQFHPGDEKVARQWGEFVLLQQANQTLDPETFAVAAKVSDSRRRLDLQEESDRIKARQTDEKIELTRQSVQIQRESFLSKIIETARNPKVREIVENKSLNNAEKIEALGREMYGEDWDT